MGVKVVFTAGGTGGHIYPAIAIAEELKSMNDSADILFIGGSRIMERDIIGRAGFPMVPLSVIGLPRRISPRQVVFFWKFGVSTIRSLLLLQRENPVCVFATGGYVSGPPVFAARALGIPVYLQEQNSYPGIATRTLARFSRMVFLGFEDAARNLRPDVKTLVTGNPVRRGIDSAKRSEAAERLGLHPALRTVFVFGGSQGARVINETVAEIAGGIVDRGFQLIWQTGAGEYERWRGIEKTGSIRVMSYIDDMAQAYAASDIVVARAGAMTIAEMTVCGLPGIMIPLATSAGNHQEHNARSLERAGVARMIGEEDLTPDRLLNEITALLTDDTQRDRMAEASRRFGNRNAARTIAEFILKKNGVN